MHKVCPGESNFFSPESLKAIFAHVDREALKFATPQFTTVGRFAVVIFQLNSEELGKLHKRIEAEMGSEKISLRIIKPFKEFYTELISVALRYGIQNLPNLESSDFVDAAEHLLKSIWKPALKGPTEAFFEWVKEEVLSGDNRDSSELFDHLKYQLLRAWDIDVINKSSEFKKIKLAQQCFFIKDQKFRYI
eukprot:TRINITY_DN4239_c0_g2_i2.p1 TRINITY_DN4239_c0_g2~~TRINITY_DN4239_c0_g2_i2.p1  ORF type:complete len:191 (-),score=21.81 TRINITY_DN4239_c0_g2_i2:23-595(-)